MRFPIFSTIARVFFVPKQGARFVKGISTRPGLEVLEDRLALSGSLILADSFTGTDVTHHNWIFGNSGGGSQNAYLTARPTALGTAPGGLPAVPAGGTPDASGSGVLRLTNNAGGQGAFVIYNLPLNSSAGISATFTNYSYNGSGADGTSFFLIDGSKSPVKAVASGGGLGYSNAGAAAGLVGGYLDIGLDEWGNFSNGTGPNSVPAPPGGGPGDFGTGGNGYKPQSIVVRGSQATGYLYLDGVKVSTIPGESTLGKKTNTSRTQTGSSHLYQIDLTPAGVLSVTMDGHPVITNFDTIGAGNTAMPATFKFGFAASTGAYTDFHEISGLTVNTESGPYVPLVNFTSASETVAGGSSFVLTAQVDVPTTQDVTIPLTFSSAATIVGGSSSPTTTTNVTIPAGQSTVSLTVIPTLATTTPPPKFVTTMGTPLNGIAVLSSQTTTNTATLTPTVSGVSPNSGPLAGLNSVTITGAGFTTGATVKFGATAATGVTVTSQNSITATAPAGTGIVDVTVTTTTGTSPTSGADKYTYTPVVASINPNFGPGTGGTTVTITGSGFTAGSTVKFGSTPAASFTFVSPTSLTVTSPAGAGVVDVTVTTSGVTSPTSAADQFSYVPVVTSISPASGPGTGGTSVVITGAGFTPGSTVLFGTTAPTSFTVNSQTSITATAPPGVSTVDVTVTTTGGTSALSGADQYTYLPVVTNVTPNSGPVVGGTVVTITGGGFLPTSTVTFGTLAATSVTYNSATSITATDPAAPTGVVDVRVANGTVVSAITTADHFYYVPPPTVTAISPKSGPVNAGAISVVTGQLLAATKVTITGTNFTGATGVMFGTIAAKSFTINSATSITAYAPPQAMGVVDVTVTNLGVASAPVSADQYTYTPVLVFLVNPTSFNPLLSTVVTLKFEVLVGPTLAVPFDSAPTVAVTTSTGTTTPLTPSVSASGVYTVVVNAARTSGISYTVSVKGLVNGISLSGFSNPFQASLMV